MTKWTARLTIGVLALCAVWLVVEGGWWLAAVVPLAVAATVLEVRWAERWPFSRPSG